MVHRVGCNSRRRRRPRGSERVIVAGHVVAASAGVSVSLFLLEEGLDLAAVERPDRLPQVVEQFERGDEVGYLSYSNRHADLMFELVSRRYQVRSTLITTNRPFAEWREVFPNAACVVSLIDRLVHNAEIVAIDGDSYRLKEARERTEQRARQRRGGKT